MIVVDSSVWIGHLRDLDTASVRRLRALDHAGDPVLVGDLIMLKVLQGARDEEHAGRIERALRQFPVAAMLDAELAVRAARNARRLRGLGVTVRNTIDIIIGTFCIERGHVLLHDDRDFMPMATHLGLRVV